MSLTPDVIISKPRKFFHDLFAAVAAIATVFAVIAFLLDGNFILLGVVAGGSALAATNIKYRYVKKVEAAGFELV